MIIKSNYRSIIFAAVIFLFFSTNANSQNLIAVQNGNSSSFFTNLDSAVNQAQNGDTIYLPGGSFTITVPISKAIHLVGVGHDPDSTQATNRTLIFGQLNLVSGSQNGSITGIFLSPNGNGYGINFESGLSSYNISRCFILGIFGLGVSNLSIRESIINSIQLGGGASSSLISNNVILGDINVNSSVIKNNIFDGFNYNTNYFFSGSNNIIENNIMRWNVNSISYMSNSVFLNNLYGGINGIWGTNQGANNFVFSTVPIDSFFVSYVPRNSNWIEDTYASNFRIRSNLPYFNGGTDGTQLGIYGGSFPWKDGSVPFNPHIQFKNIPNATDAFGNLPINIRVAAQEN